MPIGGKEQGEISAYFSYEGMYKIVQTSCTSRNPLYVAENFEDKEGPTRKKRRKKGGGDAPYRLRTNGSRVEGDGGHRRSEIRRGGLGATGREGAEGKKKKLFTLQPNKNERPY